MTAPCIFVDALNNSREYKREWEALGASPKVVKAHHSDKNLRFTQHQNNNNKKLLNGVQRIILYTLVNSWEIHPSV